MYLTDEDFQDYFGCSQVYIIRKSLFAMPIMSSTVQNRSPLVSLTEQKQARKYEQIHQSLILRTDINFLKNKNSQ